MNLDITLHLSPEVERLLLAHHRELLAAISTSEAKMTQAMDAFKVQLAAYYKKVDDWIAAALANQTNSDALVAAAVAKAEADEDVDVGALATALAAEADRVPVAPTPPAPPPDQPAV